MRAAFPGAVTRRHASLGEYLNVNAPVVTMVRQHPVRVRAEIPERLASKIRVGQPITVSIQGGSTGPTGRVVRLSPAIDAQSRSLVLEGEIPNQKAYIRPGSFAEVSITIDRTCDGIAIPRDAVVSFAGTDRVYLASRNRLDDRIVKLGRPLATNPLKSSLALNRALTSF